MPPLAAGKLRATLGRIGIHRPQSALSGRGDADSLLRIARENDRNIRAYLQEMKVPENLYDAMLQIPSELVRFLSDAEQLRYGLHTVDPVGRDLDNARWASAYGLTRQEFQRRDSRVARD